MRDRTTLRIPAVTCSSDTTTMDLGMGVYGLSSTEGDLGEANQADVQIVCEDGTPLYFISAFTTDEGNSFAQVNAGDQVIASLSEDGTDAVVTVQDVTTSVTETSTGSSALDTSEFTGAYNYLYPATIPTFTTATLGKDLVDGDYLAATSPIRVKMQPVTYVQITPGDLYRSGDKFQLTFKHADS